MVDNSTLKNTPSNRQGISSKPVIDDVFSTNNIPQNEQKVNSDTSTKYSIQNKENNAQELLSSSFSNEKNYRGSHQIENAKSITELSIRDIENRAIFIYN